MTIIDPFASEQVLDGRLVLEAFSVIASTDLDDSPTTISSEPIVVPDGDSELVALLSSEETLSPTNVIWSFEISYDGVNFFTIDGQSADDWSPITIILANMPDFRAVMKGRVVAPYFKITATGTGTDASNIVTVAASVSRVPAVVE